MSSTTDKSHVSMEQKVCPCCAIKHDSGAILFNTRLINSMEPKTVTGWSMCEDCTSKNDDGYVNLVVTVEEKNATHSTVLQPDQAYRTGEIISLRREVAQDMFGQLIDDTVPFVFIDEDLGAQLNKMAEEAEAADE